MIFAEPLRVRVGMPALQILSMNDERERTMSESQQAEQQQTAEPLRVAILREGVEIRRVVLQNPAVEFCREFNACPANQRDGISAALADD